MCVCVWGGLFACVVVGICLYACVFELSLYCQARGRYMFYDVIENVITFVWGSWGNLKTGLAHTVDASWDFLCAILCHIEGTPEFVVLFNHKSTHIFSSRMTNAGSFNHFNVSPVIGLWCCDVRALQRRWERRVRDAAERERRRGKEGSDERNREIEKERCYFSLNNLSSFPKPFQQMY